MAMIQSRNISSYTYDEDTAESLFIAIINDFALFLPLLKLRWKLWYDGR